MTCKDCIHYSMCYLIEHYGRLLETEEPCKDFKNKADVVEVVRCEKCKFLEHTRNHIPYCKRVDDYINGDALYEVSYDDFCSFGERKENE